MCSSTQQKVEWNDTNAATQRVGGEKILCVLRLGGWMGEESGLFESGY